MKLRRVHHRPAISLWSSFPFPRGELLPPLSCRYLNLARFNGHVLYSQHHWLEAAAPRVVPPHLPASFVSDFLRDSWDVQLHMFNNTLLGGAHALDPAYQVQPPAHTPPAPGPPSCKTVELPGLSLCPYPF